MAGPLANFLFGMLFMPSLIFLNNVKTPSSSDTSAAVGAIPPPMLRGAAILRQASSIQPEPPADGEVDKYLGIGITPGGVDSSYGGLPPGSAVPVWGGPSGGVGIAPSTGGPAIGGFNGGV